MLRIVRDYVHMELGQENKSISGTYTLVKESTLKHNGRDILYVVGTAIVDTSCCGFGSLLYATVPGYVVKWKVREDEAGLSVSQVEPIEDETIKREIAQALKEAESIENHNVNFW